MSVNGNGNGNGKIKFLIKLASISLFLLIVSYFTFLIISFYPFKTIIYHSVELKHNIVKAGDHITYTSFFTKYTDKVGVMTRYLISTTGDSITVITPYVLVDARDSDISKTVTVTLPQNTTPGTYYIRWVVSYDFGIRQITARGETPEFKVISKE